MEKEFPVAVATGDGAGQPVVHGQAERGAGLVSAGCSSNCGLTSSSNCPPLPSSGSSAGSTRVSEMKDRSPTIRSK